jgi:hypothetical protein
MEDAPQSHGIPTARAGSVVDSVMRHVVLFAFALYSIACGPDPNAHLPRDFSPEGAGGGSGSGTGGAGEGGAGSGGVVQPGGSGGATVTSPTNGGSGGGGPFDNGGTTVVAPPKGGSGGGLQGTGGTTATSSGGAVGSGGVESGGTSGPASGGSAGTARGGAAAGGTTSTSARGGSGGTSTPSSGALSSYTFPAGTEPCKPAKDISGGQSLNFGTTGAFCFRTADDFTDYGCSGADGRTVKINGTEITTCGGKAPAKLGSFYYFDFGPGKYDYTSVNWYCSASSCLGPHNVPSCGHYPPWQSGQTVGPCEDSAVTASPADAAAPVSSVDSGS